MSIWNFARPSGRSQLIVLILIAICTSFTSSVRAAGSGALDLSFGDHGTAVSDLESTAIVLQGDGKVVVVGYDLNCPAGTCSSNFVLVRYNSDGTLDSGFGLNGVVVTDHFGQDEAIFAAALQSDGKIVVAGGYNNVSNAPDFTGFKVFRYMPNGTLDSTFGDGGRVYESFDDAGGTPDSIVIQSDGKIVVAGSDTAFRLFVARFNSDGGLDTTFGVGGRVLTSSYNIADIKMALLDDGKFVLAGRSTPAGTFKLVKLASNGTPDNLFGNAGVATSVFPIHSSGVFRPVMAVQHDGKILVSGWFVNAGPAIPPIRRFNADGSVHQTLVPVMSGSCKRCTQDVAKILPLPDGKFYLFGIFNTTTEGVPTQMSITRYHNDGSIDLSFAYDGTSFIRHAPNPASTSSWIFRVADAAIDVDGKAVMTSRTYTTRVHMTVTPGSMNGDFDGDGRTDASVFRRSGRSWYVWNSSDDSFKAIRWGLEEDTVVPGDYNYDLKTDYSVSRPSTNVWYTFPDPVTGGGLFGQTGEIRLAADYDGDGFADQSAFGANGKWTIRYSSESLRFAWNPPLVDATYTWGVGTDVPVPADYDGDGLADLAVFRPSTGVWYVFRTSDHQYSFAQFGLGTDKLVPGDYDGDRKADLAVFRDGTWYVQKSSDGSYFGVNWGSPGDIAVPGDYDGDGKYDVAVYRPSEAVWYVLKSSDGGFTAKYFGLTGDEPIPSFFVR